MICEIFHEIRKFYKSHDVLPKFGVYTYLFLAATLQNTDIWFSCTEVKVQTAVLRQYIIKKIVNFHFPGGPFKISALWPYSDWHFWQVFKKILSFSENVLSKILNFQNLSMFTKGGFKKDHLRLPSTTKQASITESTFENPSFWSSKLLYAP
jgi:hypothetical protein